MMWRRFVKGMGAFLFLATFLLLLRVLDPDADKLTLFVDQYIRSHGAWGKVVFVLLGGAATCFGLPRQVLSFVGGYAFGMIFGTVWALFGTTLGCTFSFFYARLVARSSVEKRFAKRVARLNTFLMSAPFSMTVCIRLLPVGHNLLTTLFAGVSRIPAKSFLSGSFFGYIPQTLVFALLGSGIRVDPFWRGMLSAGLFIASSLLGWYLYRHFRSSNLLEEEPDDTHS